MFTPFFVLLLEKWGEKVQPSDKEEVDVDRLSLVIIHDSKVLFVREPGTELLFDPGGRRVEGQDDEKTLAQKVRRDLGIRLRHPLLPLLSYKAPATADKPEGTMVEQRCFMLHPDEPGLDLRRARKELVWVDSRTRDKLSHTSEGLRQIMIHEEYIG